MGSSTRPSTPTMLRAAILSVTLCLAVVAQADTGLPNYLVGLANEVPNFALNPTLLRNNELGVPSIKSSLPGLPEYLESGKCSDVGVQADFEKYAGAWYWSYMIDQPFLGDMEKCIRSDLSTNGAGFDVVTSGKTVYNANRQSLGKYLSTQEFPSASMSLAFDGEMPANYKVLETDYESYSCVYSCTTTNAFKAEFGFIFTRNPKDAQYAFAKCGEKFVANGINFAKFKEADQSCL